MGFQESLQRHLAAVRERDLDALTPTLHPDVVVLLPNGTLVSGRDAVVDLHRAWFADPSWSLTFDTVSCTELEHLASVILNVHYTEAGSSERDYFLGLAFARSGEQWLLVHDQNSVVR